MSTVQRIHRGKHQVSQTPIMNNETNEKILRVTLGALLRSRARTHPDTPAVRSRRIWGDFKDTSWTYQEVDELTIALARQLMGARIERHLRVALCGWSSPYWLLAQLAIARLGAVLVPLNPLNSEHEFEHILRSSHTDACIVLGATDSPHARSLTSIAPRVPTLRSLFAYQEGELRLVYGPTPAAEASEREFDQMEEAVEPDDLLQIQYTSGSTGTPKGVMLSHRGVVNNARFTASVLGVVPGDRWCNPLPMFHVAAASMVNIGAVTAGATNCVIPRFAPEIVLKAAELERCRLMSTAPTMIYRMADAPGQDQADLSTLEIITVGGAQLTPEVAIRLEEEWGASIVNVYGLSETSPVVTMCSPDDPDSVRHHTVGRALPFTEVKVTDYLTGEAVPHGTPGEVIVSGHGVMRGYFGDEEATQGAFRDGWFRTGDIGTIDDSGILRIVGRYKDVIIRGGENISPEEIELCISQLDTVQNVCVVGLPDADLGEVPWAVVMPKVGKSLTTTDVLTHVASMLNQRKAPQRVEIWESLPETGPGKVDRKAVRQMLVDRPRLERLQEKEIEVNDRGTDK